MYEVLKQLDSKKICLSNNLGYIHTLLVLLRDMYSTIHSTEYCTYYVRVLITTLEGANS